MLLIQIVKLSDHAALNLETYFSDNANEPQLYNETIVLL